MMAWPPSPVEVLRQIAASTTGFSVSYLPGGGIDLRADDMRKGAGVFFCDQKYLEPLLDAGMIEMVEFKDGALSGTTQRLTDKGIEAMQMLNGHRTVSNYSLPGWLLMAVTAPRKKP